jgi:Dynamitin
MNKYKSLKLPDIDIDSPETFETVATPVKPEPVIESEPTNPEINTDPLTRTSTAVFETKSDTISDRIARILAEVDDLEAQGNSEYADQVHLIHAKIFSLMSSKTKSSDANHKRVNTKEMDRIDGQMNTSSRQLYRMQTLESRLAQIEKVIGLNMDPPGKHSLLTPTGLLGSLERIEYTMSLLAQDTLLDDTLSKLQSLRIDGIDRNYESLANLTPVAHLVPHILARLVTLKEIHADAMTAVARIKDVERESEGVAAIAATLRQSQTELMKSMAITQQRVTESMHLFKK